MSDKAPLIFVRVYNENNTGDFRIIVATLDVREAFAQAAPSAEELWFTEVHIYQGDELRSVYAWHAYEGCWKPDIGQPNVFELESQNLHVL